MYGFIMKIIIIMIAHLQLVLYLPCPRASGLCARAYKSGIALVACYNIVILIPIKVNLFYEKLEMYLVIYRVSHT